MVPKDMKDIVDPAEQLRKKKRFIRHYVREDGVLVTEIDGKKVGESICFRSRDPERRRQALEHATEFRKDMAWENFFDRLALLQGKDPSVYDAARDSSRYKSKDLLAS